MINLLVCSHDPSNAVSFYRTYGPLSQIPDIASEFWDGRSSWDVFRWCDAVWIERPDHRHVQLVDLAKEMGLQVVADMDDDLLNLPGSNPLYSVYNSPRMRHGIGHCIQKADVVIASTQALADSLCVLGASPVVIPNGYDFQLFRKYDKMRPAVTKTVVWRGTHTHSGDVLPIRDQLLQVMGEHPDWKFVFMGDCPFMDLPKNAEHVPAMPIMEYHKHLYDLAPAFVIVPLEDNAFNRAKSNAAWIEATHAQAVCIAPKMPEWDRPGIRQVKASWYGEIDAAIRDLEDRDGVIQHRQQVVLSRKYIAEKLSLEKLAGDRENLLRATIDHV